MLILKKELSRLLQGAIEKNGVKKIVMSSPLKGESSKLGIKPLKIKDKMVFQVEEFIDNKAFHKNFSPDEILEFILMKSEDFKNINLFTDELEASIINNRGKIHIREKIVKSKVEIKEHNNVKKYIIPQGKPIEFLIDLGIMDRDGKILKNSYSKFRQINRYLEFIRDTVEELKESKAIGESLKVVDFGSGKSYLTFVLYYYLKVMLGFKVQVIGLDLKRDVMENCGKLAGKYGFSDLKFMYGDIKDFVELKDVDLVFSLHACNNATDYAFLKGLELDAKCIMAVPCCHKEFNQKISKNLKESELDSKLSLLTEHGILMEKMSSLLTDGFRAGVMELCGYRASVMEFIDTEHTPKNLLIKAIRDKNVEKKFDEKLKECEIFMNFLNVDPLFFQLAKKYFTKKI